MPKNLTDFDSCHGAKRTVALPPYLRRGELVYKGSLIALATPFDADNRVDYEALKRLIEFHVSEGSNGLVIAGTTGEAATLEKSEHAELIGKTVEIVDGRLPVIAGTGSNSTSQTIKLSRDVGACGIDPSHARCRCDRTRV